MAMRSTFDTGIEIIQCLSQIVPAPAFLMLKRAETFKKICQKTVSVFV